MLAVKSLLCKTQIRIGGHITDHIEPTKFKDGKLLMLWRADLGGVTVKYATYETRLIPFGNIIQAIMAEDPATPTAQVTKGK